MSSVVPRLGTFTRRLKEGKCGIEWRRAQTAWVQIPALPLNFGKAVFHGALCLSFLTADRILNQLLFVKHPKQGLVPLSTMTAGWLLKQNSAFPEGTK